MHGGAVCLSPPPQHQVRQVGVQVGQIKKAPSVGWGDLNPTGVQIKSRAISFELRHCHILGTKVEGLYYRKTSIIMPQLGALQRPK